MCVFVDMQVCKPICQFSAAPARPGCGCGSGCGCRCWWRGAALCRSGEPAAGFPSISPDFQGLPHSRQHYRSRPELLCLWGYCSARLGQDAAGEAARMWRSSSGEQVLRVPVATGSVWEKCRAGRTPWCPPQAPHILYPPGLMQTRKSTAHSQVAPLCALCPPKVTPPSPASPSPDSLLPAGGR